MLRMRRRSALFWTLIALAATVSTTAVIFERAQQHRVQVEQRRQIERLEAEVAKLRERIKQLRD